MDKLYRLLAENGNTYFSEIPGQLGGNRRLKIYGRLDCPSALRWKAKGKVLSKNYYIPDRVFFADKETAIKVGYRPCAVCMPEDYKQWKENNRQFVKKR